MCSNHESPKVKSGVTSEELGEAIWLDVIAFIVAKNPAHLISV